jgi:hypothetical protein
VMTLGGVGVYGTSTKLAPKISTKVKLVGVSNVLPKVVWTKVFLLLRGIVSLIPIP